MNNKINQDKMFATISGPLSRCLVPHSRRVFSSNNRKVDCPDTRQLGRSKNVYQQKSKRFSVSEISSSSATVAECQLVDFRTCVSMFSGQFHVIYPRIHSVNTRNGEEPDTSWREHFVPKKKKVLAS